MYSGTLKASNQEHVNGQSILFTNDASICKQFKETVHYCGDVEQEVLCINERQVMNGILNITSRKGVGAWHGDVGPDPLFDVSGPNQHSLPLPLPPLHIDVEKCIGIESGDQYWII